MARIQLLTASRCNTYRGCHREAYYKYEACLVPLSRSRGALAFGTAAHKGLEAWWSAYKMRAFGMALAVAIKAAEDALPSEDPYTVAMLRAMLTAYDARWHEWGKTVAVIAVEVQFEAPLKHPTTGAVSPTWRIAGKIDVLVKLSDGRVAVIEHKTTSEDAGLGSVYQRKLTLDGQVSMYFDGARALGHDVDVCIYDVLRKPTKQPLRATPNDERVYTKPKAHACTECKRVEKNRKPLPHIDPKSGVACEDGRVVTDVGGFLRSGQRERDETPLEYEKRLLETLAEDPDKYLVHAEVVRLSEEIEDHAWALWHTAREMDETREAAKAAKDIRAVPQSPANCFKYGSACAFIDLCERRASPRDEARFKRVTNPHAELEASAPEEP